jgi:hypothetical protein
MPGRVTQGRFRGFQFPGDLILCRGADIDLHALAAQLDRGRRGCGRGASNDSPAALRSRV